MMEKKIKFVEKPCEDVFELLVHGYVHILLTNKKKHFDINL